MKKLIITFIAVLPFFLIFTISSIGRIISKITNIPVESVFFTNENGQELLLNQEMIEIDVGEEYEFTYKIMPELASNKRVFFSSDDSSICTIDDKGIGKGIKFGATSLIITTEDGRKTSKVYVSVTRRGVEEIRLNKTDVSIYEGEVFKIIPFIEPYSAINKNVVFKSNNNNIATVNSAGEVKAIEAGETNIIVTSVQNPSVSEICRIEVLSDPPFKIKNGLHGYDPESERLDIFSISINLRDILDIAEELLTADYYITYEVSSSNAIIVGDILTFMKIDVQNTVVVIINYYSNTTITQPDNSIKLFIRYVKQ